jgi:hypothetical protein
MAKLTVKKIKEKVQHLKGERSTLDSHLQEVADYMMPNKNTILSQKTSGEKRNIQVLENTGMYCLELLAGQLHGLLTSPNSMWFEFTTGIYALDQLDNVKAFLQYAAKQTHNVLNNSNFQTEVHELYLDEVGFGTAAMYIEEDPKEVVRFSTKFIGEYFIDEDSQGRVNQIYRSWKWNAYQLVEAFGKENVGKKVMDCYEKGKDDKFEVIHAVYPASMVNITNSPFVYVSQYVLPEVDHEILSGGFREFPYVVPRWSKRTGEKYGVSPAMVALPEVKTINKMAETMIIGAQKMVDPPLQLPDDGFILPIVTSPGGLNFRRSGSPDSKIEPIFNDSRIDFGYEALKERRVRIREAFFVDQLMLQQGPQMTATEVLQRTEEKMRLLGPMLGRQQTEFLRPMIDRVFAVMLRRGVIKKEEIPEALRGRKIDVRYSSLIARSQRLSEAQNILRAIEACSPFIQMDPSVADNFNGDEAIRVIADIFGTPVQVIRTKKDRDGLRDARAQAQQAALQNEAQTQEVDSASKLAPVFQGEAR